MKTILIQHHVLFWQSWVTEDLFFQFSFPDLSFKGSFLLLPGVVASFGQVNSLAHPSLNSSVQIAVQQGMNEGLTAEQWTQECQGCWWAWRRASPASQPQGELVLFHFLENKVQSHRTGKVLVIESSPTPSEIIGPTPTLQTS